MPTYTRVVPSGESATRDCTAPATCLPSGGFTRNRITDPVAGSGWRKRASARPPATTTAPAATQLRQSAYHRDRPATTQGWLMCVNPGVASAWANSAALPNRSAGTFSRAWSTAALTLGGTARRSSIGGRGGSASSLETTAWLVGPVNGGSPV